MTYVDDKNRALAETKAFETKQKAQEKSRLEQKLSNDRSDIDKAKRELAAKSAKLQQEKIEEEYIEKGITAEQASGQKRKQEIARIQTEINSLKAKLDLLVSNRGSSEYTLEGKKRQKESELRQLERDIGALETKIANLNADMSTISQKIRSIR